MELTFKITINSMFTNNIDNLSNVVRKIMYTVTATKEDQTVSSSHTVELQMPNADNFTNFEDLTEAQVVAWIENLDEVNAIKEYLTNQLNKKILENSLEIKAVPWFRFNNPLPPNPSNVN